MVQGSWPEGSQDGSSDICSDSGDSNRIRQVDVRMVVSASVLAGILSLATSIAGLPELDTKTDA